MVPQWIIEKKRDGHVLSEEEIRFMIEGYTRDEIPDYQMAALAMAIYFKGMILEETAILTDAMMHSGDLVDTSSLALPKVDKHSTGGIGDKISLILAPLAACFGIAVPMISGRGLGITGGTLDKLESIPGYRTDLADNEFLDIVAKCGCSITGQTGQLAPADKKLYALRDVTGTVPSIPLITASIMSKKLAAGIDSLVLDVKCGNGAFMKTQQDAVELATSMVEVGHRMGKGMAAFITDMNQPLGRCAGNALEVVESIETLRGNGPEDLVEVTTTLCAEMLVLADRAADNVGAMGLAQDKLASGDALQKFTEMVELHGGDPRAIDDFNKLPSAAIVKTLPAPKSGFIADVNAEKIGRACLLLGAGRMKTEDDVDFAVGVSGLVKIGEQVDEGQPLLMLHGNDEGRLAEAEQQVAEAFTLSDESVLPAVLVLEEILPHGPRK